ncbi:hypothetical protein SAMN02982927_00345 [Sporolactobacillus nakayamae]|uniref:Uncharacterized protein n=1 Tax=Sporolactobacillus nakayamae TaxID=269670 RepID=A0A1I2NAJ0_9BACL|nr:hypothetical protein SAMN02982927_00345 [Sporolactobacillus nakayamae]
MLVLDGVQNKAKVAEAGEHGFTIIETAKGKVTKIKYGEGELFYMDLKKIISFNNVLLYCNAVGDRAS